MNEVNVVNKKNINNAGTFKYDLRSEISLIFFFENILKYMLQSTT